MERNEIKGLFKGLGIATILCTAIFYMMVLNLRVEDKSQVISNDVVIQKARDMGMVHITETDDLGAISDAYIIERAKALGMTGPEE